MMHLSNPYVVNNSIGDALMVTDDGKNNDGCKNYAILNQH
jgi:hypothetical protein